METQNITNTLREIVCEDFGFFGGQIILKGFHPDWHNREMKKRISLFKESTWFCRGDPLPEAIYLFQFHQNEKYRCSKKYTIVQYDRDYVNIIAHGWNESDPKQLQRFIDVWRKLSYDDCCDDLESFLNSNNSFPIDMMVCYDSGWWTFDIFGSSSSWFKSWIDEYDLDYWNWNLLFKCVYYRREKCIKLLLHRNTNLKFTTPEGTDLDKIISISKNDATRKILEQAIREVSEDTVIIVQKKKR